MFVAGDHKVGLERNQFVAESRNAHDVATRITLSLRAFSRARARARERSGGHPQHSRVLALLEIEDLSVREFQRVVIHIWFHS